MVPRVRTCLGRTRVLAPLATTESTAETEVTRAAVAVRRSSVAMARVLTLLGTLDTCLTRASVTRAGPPGARDPHVMWMSTSVLCPTHPAPR